MLARPVSRFCLALERSSACPESVKRRSGQITAPRTESRIGDPPSRGREQPALALQPAVELLLSSISERNEGRDSRPRLAFPPVGSTAFFAQYD
jgi:hypothetical protein